MPRIFVCYGGNWRDDEQDYVGGNLGGLEVGHGIGYEEFLLRLYKLSGVDSENYDLVLRCLYNFGCRVPPYLIRNDGELSFFLSGEDSCRPPIYLSTKPKHMSNTCSRRGFETENPDCSYQPSFPYNLAQQSPPPYYPIPPTVEEDYPSYDHFGHVPSLTPLANDIAAYDLGDDSLYLDPYNYEEGGPSSSRYGATDEHVGVGGGLEYMDGNENDEETDDEDQEWDEHAESESYESAEFDENADVDDLEVGGIGFDDEHDMGPVAPPPELSLNHMPIITSDQLVGQDDIDIELGQIYVSKEELSYALSVFAVRKNFETYVDRSTKSLLVVKCKHDTCGWRVRARKLKNSTLFKISKYNNVHTCARQLMDHEHRQARSKVIGNLIKSKFTNVSRVYRPKDIMQDMREQYGVSISYKKAWRSREEALIMVRGRPEESYRHLHAYGEALRIANPGTIYELKLDEGKYFRYVFMSLGPCIRGFLSYVRRVLVVDGTHLRGKFKGVMLSANSVDGNGQIYPIAFAVVDGETVDAWTWFFERVKVAIGAIDELVIVSDRKSSIGTSIRAVFPSAFHCFCIHHIQMNLVKHFKKEVDIATFFLAAKACRESTFRVHWAKLLSSRRAAQYLEEVGFERWARAFQCGRRFDQMTTNAAESLNALLKDARTLPITKFLDHIRGLLQDWFYRRRMDASSRQTILSEYAEKIMADGDLKSRRHGIKPIDLYIYEVTDSHLGGIVDLHARTCTCKEFDYYEIPCSHAIAAARYRNIDPYTLCSDAYSIQAVYGAYSEPIFPVGPMSEWNRSDAYEDLDILPPMRVPQVGRPQSVRIPSAGEVRQVHRCSRCGQRGHNSKTCREPLSRN